jgi:mRNA-degrading endonuclease toxin of MazEF toxin-antitoxin module
VTPRRGDIWWVRQPVHPSQAGDISKRRRPYLVVSSDPWNLEPAYPRVTLCPLTGLERVARRYDTDVILKKNETRLPKDSDPGTPEIYTVFREMLIERVARIPQRKMRRVEHALRLYLSLV